MLEALYEFSSQASCHDDQEVFQQANVSSLVEDEMDQRFDSQVILYEIHQDLQPCQSLCSERYEPNHSNCFSAHSFSEILCQEETPQDQGIENTCMKILNSEVTCSESCLPRQELFSIEDHNDVVPVSVQTQDDIPQAKLPKVLSDLFDKQKSSFDTHNMDVMFEDVQGCMDGFVDLHERENKSIVAFLFDDVLGIKDIGQQKPSIMNEFSPKGFTHQEEVIFHDYQDCLVSLFQSSVEVEFSSFISSGDGFSVYYEFPIDGPLENSQAALVLDQLFDWLY